MSALFKYQLVILDPSLHRYIEASEETETELFMLPASAETDLAYSSTHAFGSSCSLMSSECLKVVLKLPYIDVV